jgi:threonine dehydratase
LCGRLGVISTVCMPNTVPKDRVKTIEGFGRTLEIVLAVEFMNAMDRYTAKGRVLVLIHPFDDYALIAGGGLVPGVAAALKHTFGSGCEARVVTVEPDGSPCNCLFL